MFAWAIFLPVLAVSMNKLFLLACTISATASLAQPDTGSARPAVSHITRRWTNIAYATVSPAEKLDIYLPNDATGPFPVIMAIHGGGFKAGDKADGQLTPMLAGLAHGYAVVSINYRLSGEAKSPAPIQDVKAAIRWIKANAKSYQLIPGKIALWGGSAGGNLAALAGTSIDVPALDDLKLGNPLRSSRVQAVVDWFGPINFLTMDAQFAKTKNGKPDHSEANSPESELIGRKITEVPDQVALINPQTYITHNDPPFLIEHGTLDPLVPTQQSIEFARQLEQEMGREKVTLVLLEGAGHGGPAFETPENLATVFAFLDKHLK